MSGSMFIHNKNPDLYVITNTDPEEVEYVLTTTDVEVGFYDSFKNFIKGLNDNDAFASIWYDIFITRQRKNFKNIVHFVDTDTWKDDVYEFEAVNYGIDNIVDYLNSNGISSECSDCDEDEQLDCYYSYLEDAVEWDKQKNKYDGYVILDNSISGGDAELAVVIFYKKKN